MTTPTLIHERGYALGQLVRTWDRRLRLQQVFLWLPRCLMPALAVGIVLAITSRLRPFMLPQHILMLTGILLVAGLVGMLLAVWLWPRPQINAARRFDVTFGLNERVSTALELIAGRIQASDELLELQIDDAWEQAQTVRPAQHLPLIWNRREWIAVIVLTVALLLLTLLPNAQTQAITTNFAQQAALESAREEIQKITEDVAADPSLTQEQREQLLEALQASADTLKEPDVQPEEALATLSMAQSALQSQADQLSQQQQAEQAAMSAAMQTLNPANQAPANAQSQAGSGEELTQALDDLQQNLQNMDATQLQAAAQALQQAANQLQQTNPQLAQALQQAAQQLQQGNQSAAQQAMQQAMQQIQQAAQNAQNQQNSAQQMSQAAQNVQQAANQVSQQGQQQNQQGQQNQNGQQNQQGQQNQNGQQSQQGQQSQDQNGQQNQNGQQQNQQGQQNQNGQQSQQSGQQQGQQNQNGQQGQSGQQGQGQQQGSQPGEQSGQGQGQSGQQGQGSNQPGQSMQGSGAGDAQGSDGGTSEQPGGQVNQNNNPDGQGEGQYDPIYAPQRIGGEGTEQIQLDPNSSDQPIQEGNFSDNPNGNAVVPYSQVFSDYSNAANQALENDYIPLGLRDLVRDYFSSIEPTGQTDSTTVP